MIPICKTMKDTIKGAVIKAMKLSTSPMTSREVYNKIISHSLYKFNAKNPEAIVSSVLRQHTSNLTLKTSRDEKLFVLDANGKYRLIDQ